LSETLPARIGRFEIESELGRGMMGVVYRAHDPDLGRTVALKTVSLAFAVSDEEREAFQRRFLEEARIAARLSHPGIVVVHDVGRDAATGALFIALEYLSGRTLAEVLAAGPLPWKEALRLGARVARALHHAHAEGIVHRDVKPANLMVLDSGEPKILDFGVAKAPASQLTAAGQFFGTPAYMAPEQVSGQPVDARTDIFALGCVLYQMLTGRRAFEGESVAAILNRVLHEEPTAPSRLRPGLPSTVDAVVARALAKDPGRRYARGSELADDLEAVAAGRPPVHATAVPSVGGGTAVSKPAVPPSSPRGATPVAGGPGPSRARRPWAWWLAAMGLLLAGAATVVAWRVARSYILPAAEPAELSLEFEHHLKSGTLRVWLDDDLVAEEAVEGKVTDKILSFRLRRGAAQETLEVSPGRHEIRVQVTWEGGERNGRLTAEFESGRRRRLGITVGLLRRNLSLEWK
jgi:predicted Ser/Thr protein kinase